MDATHLINIWWGTELKSSKETQRIPKNLKEALIIFVIVQRISIPERKASEMCEREGR
jgi:hypothetical protein